MSSSKISINLAPLGLLAILVFVLFLGLKLGGVGQVATWSWWWVTAPLWGCAALWAGLFVLVFVFLLFIGLLKALFGR